MPYGQRILAWAGDAVATDRFVAMGGVRLPDEPDPASLQDRLNAAVLRHPVLGTGPVPLTKVDDVWAAASEGSYPPESRCLLWAYLAGRDLLLVAHHQVADPWSMRILAGDVLTGTAEPAPSYLDFKPSSQLRRLGRAVPFWEHVLHDVNPLVTDGGQGAGETTDEIRVVTEISAAQANLAGRAAQSTAFVVLLAVFAQALRPLMPDGDLVLPVLTYGRERSEWETVGLYMNVLPVRLSGTDLAEVHRAFSTAYAHEIPFPVLLDAVPAADAIFAPGGPALAQFEVIQVPPDATIEPLNIPAGLGLGGPILPVNGLVFWLELGTGDRYTVCLRYRTGLFGEPAMRALIQRFIDTWGDLYAGTC